jgi:hypothetical protein
MLEKVFGKEQSINFNTFLYVIENVCSEIFLYILIFLFECKPFNKNTLSNYETAKKKIRECSHSPTSSPTKKFIASPKLESKFSPSKVLSKSPTLKAQDKSDNLILDPLDISQKQQKRFSLVEEGDSKNILLKLAGKEIISGSKNILLNYMMNNTKQNKEELNDVPVHRKDRKPNFSELDVNNELLFNLNDEDIPILPAAKYKVDNHLIISPDDVKKISKE